MVVVLLALTSASGGPVGASTSVDYGDISHTGLRSPGPASTGLKLPLELGLIAERQGIANAVKSASNPSSSSYGKYLTLSTLQSKYGATSDERNAVVGAFKNYGVTATVDVSHLRVTATISIGGAQKLFGTKWDLYATGETDQDVAVPVDTPKLSSGLEGNVDTAPGLGLYVTTHVSASTSVSHAGQALAAGTPSSGQTIAYAGGTSGAAPLVAGMIALWDQQAEQSGLPRPGFVPPLLYSIAHNDPGSFHDITDGTNSVFGSVSCCSAGKGFDLASGLGSPLADEIAKHLHH